MNSSTKEMLEGALRSKRLALDAEADRRLRSAIAQVPAQVGTSYSPNDHIARLADVFRIEEERCISTVQSVILHEVNARIDQSDGDFTQVATTVLDTEAERIRDRFAALWGEIGPPAISSLNDRPDALQVAQNGLIVHAESSRVWRDLDVAKQIASLQSAFRLYEANMKAAQASEASAIAAKKMVKWTRWAAIFTAIAAIATAVSASSMFWLHP